MMQGIPLLAVMDDGDIVRDIESGAGRWVANGDAQGLARHIRALRDDPQLCRDMSKICREIYLKNYTTEICTGRYVAVMKEHLG
jgi:glycosyltransferase involved in cell wall biosynthesis